MGWTRRAWLTAAAALSCTPPLRAAQARPLRFATTPVFLDEQASSLRSWQSYLETRLGRPVSFVQRANYREITDLLLPGDVDCAWICGFPYVRHRAALQLVAVPVYQGAPLYRAYVIVAADDTQSHGLADLRGKVFAYSDPDSNSGWLAPQHALRQLTQDPGRFFRRTFFTWGHRKVVQAVAVGLAQGGAVDGYVWDTLQRVHPELTRATRILERYGPFGFPPIVARRNADPAMMMALQSALLGMRDNSAGRELLHKLNLDGFAQGNPALYAGIESNWRSLSA